MQEHLVEVVQKKYLAPDVVELSVNPISPRSFRFQAGQFAFFNIGGAYKAYSMISAPQESKRVSFLIKLEPKGRGSAFISNLKVGDRFTLTGPEGYFTARQRSRDVCCVAVGIGIAPFLSIIPHLLQNRYSGQLTLLYGCSSETEIFYRRELESLASRYKNFKFTPIVSRPAGPWHGATGRVTSYLETHGAELAKNVFYVCGKQKAVEDIETGVLRQGNKPENIHTEIFLR